MGKTEAIIRRKALITGGSSGIGQAAAQALANANWEVMICGRRQDNLDDTVAQIRADGGSASSILCDVSKPEQVAEMAAHIKKTWGRLDLLFNNAGSGRAVPLNETTDQVWNDTIGSSLAGTFYCCRALLPLLLKATAPTIINNASVAAHRGFPDFAAYSAAKGGVAAMSRALREELRPQSVRVTTLYAGATNSNFWDSLAGEWDRSRMMDCEDIGRLILQIAETRACAMLEEIHIMPAGGAL